MLNLESASTAATNATLPSVIKTYQRVFETILALVAFTDPDQKFNVNEGDEYDLWKPDSKACYSVVWMYSLEPPLYWLLNRAMRTKNMAYLQMLGPFAQAIWAVLSGAERGRNDKIQPGVDMNPENNPLGYMAGSLLVFRGALFSTKYIVEFQNQIGMRDKWGDVG